MQKLSRNRGEAMTILTCQEYAGEWSAWFDGYEHILGRGPMEQAAIDDLREQVEEGHFDNDNLFEFAKALTRAEVERVSKSGLNPVGFLHAPPEPQRKP